MKDVKMAGRNVVTAHFVQNLTRVDKAGNVVNFYEEQEFSSETFGDVTGKTIALWLIGVCKHFCSLSRLQGKAGFKLSKPISLSLTVNNRTEKMSFRFSLSAKRLENMIDQRPKLVAEAFNPSPALGVVTEDKIRNYFNNVQDLVIAASIPAEQIEEAQLELSAPVVAIEQPADPNAA